MSKQGHRNGIPISRNEAVGKSVKNIPSNKKDTVLTSENKCSSPITTNKKNTVLISAPHKKKVLYQESAIPL